MGGEIQWVCASVMSATAVINSGKVRGIASLGLKRASSLPDLPTAVEQGLPAGFKITNLYRLWVRSGTPRPIIDRLNRVVAEGFRTPQMVQRLANDGSEPADYMTPDQLRVDVTRLYGNISRQVKEIGLEF